ncbi:hypothetical protein [Paenibacillus sp. MZ03-122A]|uniref:hypothetical protein n=1 Tax=Paenibacillus sp. MZ03-122A TaxID=2962033 RepID=UPI00349F74E0
MQELPQNSPNDYLDYTYTVLNLDIGLFVAALSQVRVYVVQPLGDDMVEVVDYGDPSEKFTPESVEILGNYYMRGQFEFRVHVLFILFFSLWISVRRDRRAPKVIRQAIVLHKRVRLENDLPSEDCFYL